MEGQKTTISHLFQLDTNCLTRETRYLAGPVDYIDKKAKLIPTVGLCGSGSDSEQ